MPQSCSEIMQALNTTPAQVPSTPTWSMHCCQLVGRGSTTAASLGPPKLALTLKRPRFASVR